MIKRIFFLMFVCISAVSQSQNLKATGGQLGHSEPGIIKTVDASETTVTVTKLIDNNVTVSNSSIPVTGTFYQATQPVSISSMPSTPVTGTFWQATQPVSIATMPSTPVTGTFWQATQPVSIATMPSTPVTGTFWQTTQPVSGIFYQATQPVSIATMPSTPVTGTFWQATQPVSGTFFQTTQPVTIGNSTGKTNVCKTGNLVTTTVTADQVILTYTVTSGKTFYLMGYNVTARLTTYAATATNFGVSSLENPSGTKLNTCMIANAGVINPPYDEFFSEPMPIAAGTVIRIVCTPSSTTSYTWQGNLFGYEK
jgi:uncharacterized membrane protein YoaK (UPF0700 family)